MAALPAAPLRWACSASCGEKAWPASAIAACRGLRLALARARARHNERYDSLNEHLTNFLQFRARRFCLPAAASIVPSRASRLERCLRHCATQFSVRQSCFAWPRRPRRVQCGTERAPLGARRKHPLLAASCLLGCRAERRAEIVWQRRGAELVGLPAKENFVGRSARATAACCGQPAERSPRSRLLPLVAHPRRATRTRSI